MTYIKIKSNSFWEFLVLTGLVLTLSTCNEPNSKEQNINCDVLVYGNGTGAVSAAIQSARGGASTILVSPSPWLGGMLSSAGVSAIDGNHKMPSGLWGEFRKAIYEHYGGPDSVATGWVSNTNFEPHVADGIWKSISSQTENLTIIYQYELISLDRNNNWKLTVSNPTDSKTIVSTILIDGTDLGDLLQLANVSFDIGWDQDVTSPVDFTAGQDYLQDLTYCAILKDYKKPLDIQPPPGYDPNEFKCACKTNCDYPEDAHSCATMLDYAKLPRGKYLLNWPIHGNDLFPSSDILDVNLRPKILAQAKAKTIRFAYYIYSHLGRKNLWLADDEFDTPDLLPFEAYYREGRRMQGKIRIKISHIIDPYKQTLYRTGIAVGDYPVDHHHDEYKNHQSRAEFPKIPSFTIPLGALIPRNIPSFLVADKSISVSHEVNGTSRLQPVIIQVGQCAGALAAISIKESISIDQVSVRQLQQTLLNHSVYLQPFFDVPVDDEAFQSIQRIGCTGILRGTGVPFKWANQTWFYPDSTIVGQSIIDQITELIPSFSTSLPTTELLTFSGGILIAYELLQFMDEKFNLEKVAYFLKIQNRWKDYSDRAFEPFLPITKKELSLLLDKEVDPFHKIEIDLVGKPLNLDSGINNVEID